MPTYINSFPKVKYVYIRESKNENFEQLKKIYSNNGLVYSASQPVTYCVDSSTVYTEEVEFEKSCLSPTTFTPSKSGWTFVGWREDKTASASVLSAKVVGTDPITLYAVFEQTITLSYEANGGSGTISAQSGTRYYNNGTVANPTFSLKANGFTRTDHSFVNWAIGSASGIQYSAGASVTLSANTTFYAVWKRIRLDVLASLGVSSIYQVGSATKNYGSFDITNYTTLAVSTSIFTGGDEWYDAWGGRPGVSAYLVLSNGTKVNILTNGNINVSSYTGNAYIQITTETRIITASSDGSNDPDTMVTWPVESSVTISQFILTA